MVWLRFLKVWEKMVARLCLVNRKNENATYLVPENNQCVSSNTYRVTLMYQERGWAEKMNKTQSLPSCSLQSSGGGSHDVIILLNCYSHKVESWHWDWLSCKDRNQLHLIIFRTFLGGTVGSGKGAWTSFRGLVCASGRRSATVTKARQMRLSF